MKAYLFLSILLTASLPAIPINVTYEEEDCPYYDPDGTILMAHARAAAFLGICFPRTSDVYDISFSWDRDITGPGEMWIRFEEDACIDIATVRNWFFDDTPYENEELTPSEINLDFVGTPIPLIETGYWGDSPPDLRPKGNLTSFPPCSTKSDMPWESNLRMTTMRSTSAPEMRDSPL